MLNRIALLIYKSRHAAPLLPCHLSAVAAPFALIIVSEAPPEPYHLIGALLLSSAAILGAILFGKRLPRVLDNQINAVIDDLARAAAFVQRELETDQFPQDSDLLKSQVVGD